MTNKRQCAQCYACNADTAAGKRESHIYLCQSCWLKVVRPDRELDQVLAAIRKFKTAPDALDSDDYHDLKLLGLWPRFRADADLILQELDRRSQFERKFRPALLRQLRTGDAQERHRLAAEGAGEISRRMAFDDEHPGIYRTGQERYEAYAVLLPPSLTEEAWDESMRKRDTAPVTLPFGQPEPQTTAS